LIDSQKLFFLGVGNTAWWVASQAEHRYTLFGTTRDINKMDKLKGAGIEPILLGEELSSGQASELKSILKGAFVLVSYPPDRLSDERFGRLVGESSALIYISSTGVYGRREGVVDETTPVDADFDSVRQRLDSEQHWLNLGAIVLRAPGLYCPGSGLHIRLKNGTYHLPADGSNYTSRIHLKDLGRLILAAFEKPLPKKSIYVVGDLEPASQIEVVTWLCKKMDLAIPDSVPLDQVPKSLQTNRQVSPKKILSELNFELEFPTYREGFAHCLSYVDPVAS
jgi:hypothetical protein